MINTCEMMKNRLILLLAMLLGSTAVLAQNELKLRRLHLYRDGAAILEYNGLMSTRQARYQMPLPATAVAAGIQVRLAEREKLVNYQLHEVEKERFEALGSIQDLLKANVGQNVTIEAFEGRESVGYSGELLPIHPAAEVVFLRTGSSVETIPIHAIQHLTGGKTLQTNTSVKHFDKVLTVYLTGDFADLNTTILIPVRDFSSDARYLLDFDKEKAEMSLDLSISSPMVLEDMEILYYNHPYELNEVAAFSSQAAFRFTGVNVPAKTKTNFQVLATEVPLALSDEVAVPAWEPGDQALTSKTTGKRYLSLTNVSQMDWFSSVIYERKGMSLGRIPAPLPEIPKKATIRMEYGPSPYVLTDNARLVKVKKRAVDLNGMRYDSYLYVGRIEIRNTSLEAGRVRVVKQCVPDTRRNYWFANQYLDLKAKTKQEVQKLEYEVKVEANDVAFYSYRYELLIPSDN